MIAIDHLLCDGCKTCIDICPEDALDFRDGVIVVDGSLCRGCYACANICPQGAIFPVEEVPSMEQPKRQISVPPPREQALVEPSPSRSLTIRELAVPALGSFLLWTGKELLPRILNSITLHLDTNTTDNQSVWGNRGRRKNNIGKKRRLRQRQSRRFRRKRT
jgi:NAD-dependent dihydropyrimidine dehydrogenase PreA subunit